MMGGGPVRRDEDGKFSANPNRPVRYMGAPGVVKKAATKLQPRTDLTHVFFTGNDRHHSLQGLRCKIVLEGRTGHVYAEFEDGRVVSVNKNSLKELPRIARDE